MIAELFYPKELKEIITDLRAKDDLNERALDRFNKYLISTLVKAFFFCTCCFLFIFYQAPSYLLGSVAKINALKIL